MDKDMGECIGEDGDEGESGEDGEDCEVEEVENDDEEQDVEEGWNEYADEGKTRKVGQSWHARRGRFI